MPATTPLVSVGLPVWNGERYLDGALEGLLGQTLTDLELVISDNASTDRTEAICRAWAARDPRIRYERNPENLGASPNFNRVRERARGRYFKWAAYDDEVEPELLARCVEALESRPDAVLCQAATLPIDAEGQPLEAPGELGATRQRLLRRGVIDPPRPMTARSPSRRFAGVLLETHWSYEIFGLVRRELLARVAPMASFYGGDQVLLGELALAGPWLEVPAFLFRRRFHDQTSTAMAGGAARDAWVDPRARHRVPPVVRFLRGFSRGIAAADLTAAERLRCRAVLARWLLQPERARLLWRRLWRLPGRVPSRT